VRQLAAAFPARRDQLAGRALKRGTWTGEARASSQEKSGSKLPHSRVSSWVAALPRRVEALLTKEHTERLRTRAEIFTAREEAVQTALGCGWLGWRLTQR